MKPNIGIIGFMGTGKTSVGKALARQIGMHFEDSDDMVEQMAGKQVSRIFAENGEEYFRHLESLAVRDLCQRKHHVLSFGGGVLFSQENIEHIRRVSKVILLKASPLTIHERLLRDNSRPLLETENERLRAIIDLMRLRENLYARACDIEIDTDGKDINCIVTEICRRLHL